MRELENTIQSSIIFSKNKKLITPEHLSKYFIESCKNPQTTIGLENTETQEKDRPMTTMSEDFFPDPDQPMKLKEVLIQTEKNYVEKTLQKTGGNVARAARFLGVTPPTLHYKIKKYNFTTFKE